MRVTAASLQVIVTTRPAAYANSPIFPEDNFIYYHLNSISRPLAEAKCRDIVATKIVKLGEIARRDKWFTNW